MWIKGILPTVWNEKDGPMPLSVNSMVDDSQTDPAGEGKSYNIMKALPNGMTAVGQLFDASGAPVSGVTITLGKGGTWYGKIAPKQVRPPLPGEPTVYVSCGFTFVGTALEDGGGTNECHWTPTTPIPVPEVVLSVEEDGKKVWSQSYPANTPVKAVRMKYSPDGKECGAYYFKF